MAGLFNSGRTLAPSRAPSLRPAAAAAVSAERPVAIDTGGNAQALAEALAGLSGSVRSFLDTRDAIQSDPASLENREWVARAQTMNAEELAALAESGTHEGIRVREDALWSLMGEKAAADYRRDWSTYYNTEFDRTSGDADAEMEQRREEYAENLPSDMARAAFYRATDNFVDDFVGKDLNDKLGHAKGQIHGAIVDSFGMTAEDALAGGASAEEAAAAVFDRSASNRQFLGLSGQEQNATVYAAAERAALNGDYDLAYALLHGERKGADGRTVPPLANTPEYAAKSYGLLQDARGVKRTEAREEGFSTFTEVEDQVNAGTFTKEKAEQYRGKGHFSDAELASKVEASAAVRQRTAAAAAKENAEHEAAAGLERRKGQVLASADHQLGALAGVTNIRDVEIPDKDGSGTITITKEEQIDAAVARREDEWRDRQDAMVKDGVPPDQAAAQINAERMAWYSGNNLENEEWSALFTGLPAMASVEILSAGGAGAIQVSRTAELYRTLKAQNPAYAQSLVGDADSRTFLEDYDRGIRVNRLTPEASLLQAARWAEMPEAQKAAMKPPVKVSQAVAERALKDTGADDTPANRAIVAQAVDDIGRQGLTEKAYHKEVGDYLKTSTVPVRGVLVPNHRDMPADFSTVMEARLSELDVSTAKKWNMDEGELKGDLYIVPVSGESKWAVFSKTLGNQPTGDYITPADLDAQRETSAKKIADDAAAHRKARGEARKSNESSIIEAYGYPRPDKK